MNKKLAVLTLHGMGDTRRNCHVELEKKLSKNISGESWSKVHFSSIFYSDIFQNAQNKYFNRIKSKVDIKKFREFLHYGFSDVGGLEHSRSIPGSAYKALVQDFGIKAGGFTSWNPFSHGEYRGDDDVLDPLADHILRLSGSS
jgi:hypothetical protein